MILLVSANDLIRVVTTSAATTSVQASYVDLNGSTVTPGRANTAISSAATTTVVPSPGSGVARTLKTLTVTNEHASTAQTVTVEHFDGVTAARLFRVTLAAGEALHYHEAAGWIVYDAFGRTKNNAAQGGSSVAVGAVSAVALAADVANAATNVWADITGLSFSVTAGEIYWFEVFALINSSAAATGCHLSMNGPASPTLFGYQATIPTAATAATVASYNTYSQPAAALGTVPYTTGNVAWLAGFVQPSANGTMQARLLAEAATVTAKAGSLLRWMRTL